MAKFSLEDQLAVLSDAELAELKKALILQRAQTGGPVTKGLLTGAQGFLSGLQGRAFEPTQPEPIKLGDSELAKLRQQEELKNLTDPTRIMAQKKIDEINRRKSDSGLLSSASGVSSSGDVPARFIQIQKGIDDFGNPIIETIENPERKIYDQEQANLSDPSRQTQNLKLEEIKRKQTGGVGISAQSASDIPMRIKVSEGVDEFGNPIIKEIENPYFRQQMDIEKSKQIEAQKPYSSDEIRVASAVDLVPSIDKLINLLETEDVYESNIREGKPRLPLGASRISAFGSLDEGIIATAMNSLKRGLTAKEGREAGLLLQDIKQTMFGPGGAALTETEVSILGGLLNPAYKTETKWISDLKTAKQRLLNKARMLRPNPQEAIQGVTQPLQTTDDDPLGIR